MLDKLLSFVSLKHDLYQKLKLQPIERLSLDNFNNVNIDGIYPFHKLAIDKLYIDSRNFIPTNIAKFSMSTEETCQIADLFNPIFEVNHYPTYAIDISEIQAFSASKSNLDAYSDVDVLLKKNRPELIQSITEEALKEMLSHEEISIVNSPETTSDSFSIFGWSPKIAICNHGGFHHLAAAQYIAKQLDQFVCLEAKTTCYTLNEAALKAFNQRYVAFVLTSSTLNGLVEHFERSELKFIRMDFNPSLLIDHQVYFFETLAENSRIISLFKERYTCLNEVLAERIQFQNQNRILQDFSDFIGCTNIQKTAI
ncbi:DUF6685 family protein [Acinetobacter sp. YH01009]|uniref:DUF6685 family protein n=1 Tax=Acinetobacter sp. YH01009 TaxID=2601025 RepID=UPI0015D3984F|nr:DUF6685 family protein [Acinetobacter sp. YH01009]